MMVFTVGNQNPFSLEASYKRGFEELGIQVRPFDIFGRQQTYVRLGTLGRLFHTFVPVEAWQRKVNRELALAIIHEQPDLVLVFCNAPVLAGTLAFVRSVASIPFVLVWPDPLLQLQAHVLPNACLYDGVATYARATVPVFEQMGFKNVHWVPLAADETLHGHPTSPQEFRHDLTFVGAWRPEREQALTTIRRLFPSLKMRVQGTDWQKAAERSVRSLTHNKPLRGKHYADAFQTSRINLNVIDDTCRPAANMRFFEISIAQGLQLSSSCPEFADTYRHQRDVLYYSIESELAESIEWVLTNPSAATEIRHNAYALTVKHHTYQHRAKQMLRLFCPAANLQP
jgi:spore maturation protein CgeB